MSDQKLRDALREQIAEWRKAHRYGVADYNCCANEIEALLEQMAEPPTPPVVPWTPTEEDLARLDSIYNEWLTDMNDTRWPSAVARDWIEECKIKGGSDV